MGGVQGHGDEGRVGEQDEDAGGEDGHEEVREEEGHQIAGGRGSLIFAVALPGEQQREGSYIGFRYPQTSS